MATKNLIDTASKRKRLAIQKGNEPHWHKISKGRYIGFRWNRDGSGTWLSRLGKERTRVGGEGEFDYTEALAKVTKEQDTNDALPEGVSPRYTVGNAITAYLDTYAINHSQRNTNEATSRFKRICASNLGSIGKVPLTRLTTGKLNAWKTAMVKDLIAQSTEADETERQRKAQNSTNRSIASLKAALNLAFENGNCSSSDPWGPKRLKKFKAVNGKREFVFEPSHLKRIFETAAKPEADVFMVSLLTGARPGELVPLKVEDFNAAAGTLTIPKGKTGRRVVHLTTEPRAYLTKLTKGKLPKATLLPNPRGTDPWSTNELGKVFRQLRIDAQLPAESVIYSFRHTFITRQIEAGKSIALIATNCGTSPQMIYDSYSHVKSKVIRDAMEGVSFF